MNKRYQKPLDPDNLAVRYKKMGIVFIALSAFLILLLSFMFIMEAVTNHLTQQLLLIAPTALAALIAMFVSGVMAVRCGVRLERAKGCWTMGIVFLAAMLLSIIMVWATGGTEIETLEMAMFCVFLFPAVNLFYAWQLRKGLRYPPAPPFVPQMQQKMAGQRDKNSQGNQANRSEWP